ncbi:hypothetical protein BJ165DRAFT_1510520 [Panaeolus papilionaceus]|nr:hypothetical protein BJ165DRAFT_1510520 [Panaeolus papilionaceus]
MDRCLPVNGADIGTSLRRSLFKIVWSCATTLFACTYVAIHPNISANESDWVVTMRRIGLLIAMGLVPELVVLWALEQRILAISLRIIHRKQGWTQAHSFFVIMGGFCYYDNEEGERKTLDYRTLVSRYEAGLIEWPTPDIVSEPQIKDRSKADLVTKTIAVVQTLWFCIQFITRLIVHLHVTELEIATFAYAVLNIIVYMLWWNKPFDVRSQIHLRGINDPVVPPAPSERPVPLPTTLGPPQREEKLSAYLKRKWEDWRSVLVQVKQGPLDFLFLPYNLFQRVFAPFGQKYTDYSGTPPGPLLLDSHVTQNPIQSRIGRFEYLLLGVFKQKDASNVNYPFAICVAIIFGGIHLIAWPFTFPSIPEMWLWRASSLALVAPAILLMIMRIPRGKALFARLPNGIVNLLAIPAFFGLLLVPWVYMFARITILLLPLIALRRLPCDANDDINWLGIFFPHI